MQSVDRPSDGRAPPSEQRELNRSSKVADADSREPKNYVLEKTPQPGAGVVEVVVANEAAAFIGQADLPAAAWVSCHPVAAPSFWLVSLLDPNCAKLAEKALAFLLEAPLSPLFNLGKMLMLGQSFATLQR
jgi:hypothetical protein